MNGQTVLLVEDNFDNRAIYRTVLEHGGYTVIEAADGQEGLDATREKHPDIILLDVSIPVIDGWEVARILKADPELSSIPIVAITAHALASDRRKAEEVGCDGYLAKPVEPRRVLEEVKRFLERETPGVEPAS